MRIGVDANTWNNRRGFGRFTRELLEAVIAHDPVNEYLFFVDSQTAVSGEIPDSVETISVQTSVSAMQAASSTGRRSMRDLWAMSSQVLKHKVDLFFFPAVYSYFPILNRAKIIVTIHDVIADHHPELIFSDSRLKFFWKLKQNLAIYQSDLVLTVSDYSKREIIEYFSLPPKKVRSISEAARSIFREIPPDEESRKTLLRYKIDPDEKFLLYVGGISPHKNLETLVKAFNRIVSQDVSLKIKLILVGDYKDDPFYSAYPSVKSQIDKDDLAEMVIFTGFIDDLELAHLYNAATMVVLPSLEEGFGLPAVEAMACGTPVAASNRGSLPEVLGGAGRFFDPLDTNNMAEVISEVLHHPRLQEEMRQKGLAIAESFRWKKAAIDTVAIFNEVVAK